MPSNGGLPGMRLRLRSIALRILLVAACCALAAAYVAIAARHWRATRGADRPELASLQRAAVLEPGNADYRDRIGRYYYYVAQDASSALPYFRSAVALNSHQSRYWLDLAAAEGMLGDAAQRTRVLERAVAADPNNPDVAWEAGNWYLGDGNLPKALEQFHNIMERAPWMLDQTLNVSWRATGQDAGAVLTVLPRQPDAHLAFLKLLVEQQKTAAAERVWTQLIALRQPFRPKSAFFYVDFLLRERLPDQALRVWTELGAVNPAFRVYIPSENRIVNAGFEEPLLDAGLDWRFAVPQTTQFTVDSLEFHGGSHSLSLAFDGESTGDPGLVQFVPLQPSTRYHFSAYVKSEEIFTASGPRFSIADPFSGERYLLTDAVTGTTPWRKLEGDFETGPETKVVVLDLARVPNQARIKGTLWIDDVELVSR